MPDYKKKKVSRFGVHTKPPKNRAPMKDSHDEIKMHQSRKPLENVTDTGRFRVVKGKKLEKKQHLKIAAAALTVFVAAYGLLTWLLPVNLHENIGNVLHTFGSGEYPIELSGSETVSSDMRNGYYYTLTDTSLYAFTNGGKQIYKSLHGYSAPVLKTSETRALVFDQGGGSLAVYNLSRKVNSISDEKVHIITAAISRSGVYAVAAKTDNYASTVTVYDRKGKEIYVWNSAKDTVNSVAVSPSGKKLAVSTVNANAGSCVAKVMVFSFDSADPTASFDIADAPVYSLENLGRGFMVLTSEGGSFVDWSKYRKSDIKNESEMDMFRRGNGAAVMVFNRSSDRSDNKVLLVSQNGEKQTEFGFKGVISDIEYSGGHIYIISDTAVYSYSKKGELLQSGECDYGCKRFAVISADKLAVMIDNRITTSVLQKEEK